MDQLEYYTFMGYSSEQLRDRYGLYAERFAAGARVVDVACGRGEFLELLRERGVEGVGVDADASMVAEVRGRGLHAEAGDGVAFLRAHAGEFDGVFAAHVIEHMEPAVLDAFVQAAAGALRPGGRLILVTPNPANLAMQLRDFWIDLQHVRFYSPEIMRWLLHRAGLSALETGVNERYRSEPAAVDAVAEELPFDLPPTRAVGRERVVAPLLPPSVAARLDNLEARVNVLSRWMRSLYPGAEYWVSGTR